MHRTPWGNLKNVAHELIPAEYLPAGFEFTDPSRWHYTKCLELLEFWQQRKIEDPDAPSFKLRAYEVEYDSDGVATYAEARYGESPAEASRTRKGKKRRKQKAAGAGKSDAEPQTEGGREPGARVAKAKGRRKEKGKQKARDSDSDSGSGVRPADVRDRGASRFRPRATSEGKGKQKAEDRDGAIASDGSSDEHSDASVLRAKVERVDEEHTDEEEEEERMMVYLKDEAPIAAREPVERHAFLRTLSSDPVFARCCAITALYTVSETSSDHHSIADPTR